MALDSVEQFGILAGDELWPELPPLQALDVFPFGVVQLQKRR
jgi:hypothetical protein